MNRLKTAYSHFVAAIAAFSAALGLGSQAEVHSISDLERHFHQERGLRSAVLELVPGGWVDEPAAVSSSARQHSCERDSAPEQNWVRVVLEP